MSLVLGVNGRFLGARATGVQRFAGEIVRRLWADVEQGVLLLPRGVEPPPDLPAHVTVVRGRATGHRWERMELPASAHAAGCAVVLSPANTVPASGGPHVVVVHDVEPLVRPELFAPAFRAWYRLGVAPAVRRAAGVVTVSNASAREIAGALGIDAGRIRIADQGAAPLDAPATAAAVDAVRRRFALFEPYVLAVGGTDPRKNVAFLGRVMAEWHARRRVGSDQPPQLVVVSGGVGRIFARGRGLEGARGAGDLHLGRVDDETLRALYTGAAALAFPSISEGFGRPPLEALACGAPVVTSPYPAAEEVLGDAALRVPLVADAWVDALETLVHESPEDAARRRARGRAQAASHSWADGAAAVLDACRAAAGETPRVGRRSRGAAAERPVAFPDGAATPPAPSPYAGLRVALVHDWFTGMRGGEKVVEALLELFPRADIFTLLHIPGAASPAIEARRIETSFVQRLPDAARRYRSYLPLFPRAIESFDLAGYDLVVSSSHCVAKGVRVPPGVPHLCYCHTPMRYIWDQADAYLAPGRSHPLVRAVAPLLLDRLRRWDQASAARVGRIVANSANVRDRIRRHWGRDADVVYPPVALERFAPAPVREDFYLIVSALVPYKRVDLALEVFGRLGRPLVVAGSGPDLERLRAVAPPGTRFTGWIDDAEIAALMGRCRALVMPGVEDFGIAPVEAQAAGAPVIALGQGGALETVIAGDGPDATGVFFAEPTVEALTDAVRRFEARAFDPAAARANAQRFSRRRFLEGVAEQVDRVLGAARPGGRGEAPSVGAIRTAVV